MFSNETPLDANHILRAFVSGACGTSTAPVQRTRKHPEAHIREAQLVLPIKHRSTVKGGKDPAPCFGPPRHGQIGGLSPIGDGVWLGGGVGFR
ncbi:hypothetical protein [Roseivivax lentus]|uniref:hypothetical protein n=1 Tax=Roseivivax lentus TaxID=633194 RepID=UPI00117ABF94|nr:hypothetical protein [Roseivivax lentus]